MPKQDELVLASPTPAKSHVQNAGSEESAIYEKFIEYLRATRKNCDDALKYRQDIIQLASKDKAKMVMAMYFSKQHAAALAPHWSEFAKKYAVTITLEEAATRSASRHNDVVGLR